MILAQCLRARRTPCENERLAISYYKIYKQEVIVLTFYDVSHWTIETGRCSLLLFAQSMEELLAPHSHDSHKVPILDFHYICYEIKHVISLVEDDVLDRGNLIPLFSEMESLFLSDTIAQEILGTDFHTLFYKKNVKGEYEKNPLKIEKSKDLESVIPDLKRTINYITAEFARNDQYYTKLVGAIRKLIENDSKALPDLHKINSLTRIFASELINKGFSQTYIYDCIKKCFFSFTPVNSISSFDMFCSLFSSEEKEYTVYLPINSYKQKNALEKFGAFKIEDNIFEMFSASVPFVLKHQCTEIDPYKAREETLALINFCLSINQFILHNKFDYNPLFSEVVEKKSREVFSIKRPELPIVRGYSNAEDIGVRDLLETSLHMRQGVFQVLELHSAALISKNTENQIINLWTAIEVAVPVVRKENHSRINQICNVLTTSLSIEYFKCLLVQFLADIELICRENISVIESIECEEDTVFKLLAIIALSKYSSEYDQLFTGLLESAPLLACRLDRYKQQWSSTEIISKTYKKHCVRLSQQIMRIYRTRNMLVHDGSTLPYSEYILQNLHYYVDSFVRFVNLYRKKGYTSVQSIIDAAQLHEQLYLYSLGNDVALTDKNYKQFICGLCLE